eukprot:4118190-Alexandrium_andersonii.AAC.1
MREAPRKAALAMCGDRCGGARHPRIPPTGRLRLAGGTSWVGSSGAAEALPSEAGGACWGVSGLAEASR